MLGPAEHGPFISTLRFLGHNVIIFPRGENGPLQTLVKGPNECIQGVGTLKANRLIRNAQLTEAIEWVTRLQTEISTVYFDQGGEDRK